MNKLIFFLLNVALFECSSRQKEFPGNLKGFSAATLQPLWGFMNSSSCIQHLKNQKEKKLEIPRGELFFFSWNRPVSQQEAVVVLSFFFALPISLDK